MKTFQKPLTSGEEAHYVRLLREGDADQARAAKDTLIERNLRWWLMWPKNTRTWMKIWKI